MTDSYLTKEDAEAFFRNPSGRRPTRAALKQAAAIVDRMYARSHGANCGWVPEAYAFSTASGPSQRRPVGIPHVVKDDAIADARRWLERSPEGRSFHAKCGTVFVDATFLCVCGATP